MLKFLVVDHPETNFHFTKISKLRTLGNEVATGNSSEVPRWMTKLNDKRQNDVCVV